MNAQMGHNACTFLHISAKLRSVLYLAPVTVPNSVNHTSGAGGSHLLMVNFIMVLIDDAGNHDNEVSSGVHSKSTQPHAASRLSRQKADAEAGQETSSLQTLAAAADSGKL